MRAFTDKFFDIEPELAERLCPVARDKLDKYCVMREVEPGEVAWLYAPYKVDKVTTVFFVEDGRCYVKKVLEKRARRWRKSIFVQHGMPPTPIYRGPTARDLMTPAIERGDVEEVERQMIRFIDELQSAYPPIRSGVLPECTCDAIPQNCVIDGDGKYHFFDLEGDMKGGVPLAYLIYRIAYTTIARTPKNPGVWFDLHRIVSEVDRHYGVEPDDKAHAAITRELKRYSTFSVSRVLTNVWMSLLPFKSWKRRFRWWTRTPMLLD